MKFFYTICFLLCAHDGYTQSPAAIPLLVQNLEEVRPAFDENNVSIVFGCDDNYAPYLAVCLLSLMEHSSPDCNYDIWILDGGISEDNKNALLSMAQNQKNFSIRFFDISRLVDDNREKLRIYSGHIFITVATYFRLFIPQIFASYKRVVYLDCDMIINADIEKLFSVDLNGKAVGAVSYATKCSLAYQENAKTIRGNRWKSYFFPGVMVFDIKKALYETITSRSLEFLATKQNSEDRFFEDQDALNVACIEVALLDEKWLLLVGITKRPSARLEDNYIIHYCNKPWREYTYLDDAWWDYAAKTPLYQVILTRNWKSIIKKKIAIQIAYFLVALEHWWFATFLSEYHHEFKIAAQYNHLQYSRKMAAYEHLQEHCLNYLR